MTSHDSPWRLASVTAMLVIAAGCASSSEPNTATPSSTTSLAAGTTTVAATDQTTTTSIPAAELLAVDLSSIPDDYEFTSTTSTGQTEALRIDGRRVNGVTELAISSTAASLQYVVAADGSTWVRTDVGDPWVIDDPLTIGDPLEPLRHPTDVSWESSDGDTNVYRADFEAALFGLPDGPSLALAISTRPGQVAYRFESDGAAVEMNLKTATDRTPIDLPVDPQTG